MTTPPKFIRLSAAAERYSVAEETILSWIASAGFPRPMRVHPGSPRLFSVAQMDAWDEAMARQRHKPIIRGAIATRRAGGGNG